MSEVVHVAVAVIVNKENEVCISLRHQDSHQGGLWEFPGGKVEQGETVKQALNREIKEELGLEILQSRSLITVTHAYHDKEVCLHVFKAQSYQGMAKGLESQQVKWVKVSALSGYEFPGANLSIIKALSLPDKYLITGKFSDSEDFLTKLKNALDNNITLVQLRLKNIEEIDVNEMQSLTEHSAILCRQAGAKLMINMTPEFIDTIDLSNLEFDGFHADSHTLELMSSGKYSKSLNGKLLSASCHNDDELKKAINLNADFVVLSPVRPTSSHPDMPALGWDIFNSMIEDLPVPAFALGGVSADDMETSWEHGAQGIAAISAFWK